MAKTWGVCVCVCVSSASMRFRKSFLNTRCSNASHHGIGAYIDIILTCVYAENSNGCEAASSRHCILHYITVEQTRNSRNNFTNSICLSIVEHVLYLN